MPGRRLPVVFILSIIALLFLSTGGMAHGQSTGATIPSGRFGVSAGVRQGLGSLGSDYGIGAIARLEAGYHPTSLERRLSLGVHWSFLWGWFGFDDAASVAGSLALIEVSLGAKVRMMLDRRNRMFFALGSGFSLLRTNVPIPPDDERMYRGPYLSIGVETLRRIDVPVEAFPFGFDALGFEARYGFIAGGPGSISVMVGFGLGR